MAALSLPSKPLNNSDASSQQPSRQLGTQHRNPPSHWRWQVRGGAAVVVCGARCEGAGPGCRGRPGGGVRGGGISGACCRLPGRLPAAARCRQLPRQPVAPQGAHGTAPRPTRAAARGQHAHTCPRPVQQGHTCAGSGQQAHTCTCPGAAGPDLRPHVRWPWAAGPGCWRCVMLSVPPESCSPTVVQRGLFRPGC